MTLSKYPFLNHCVYDNRSKFNWLTFLELLEANSLKSIPTTVKNSQSNAIYTHMHQTVANVLRCVMRTKDLTLQEQTKQIMDNTLGTVIHTTRCAVNHTMKISLGALAFCRDKFIDILIIAVLITIRNNRLQLIGTNLVRHNHKCYD